MNQIVWYPNLSLAILKYPNIEVKYLVFGEYFHGGSQIIDSNIIPQILTNTLQKLGKWFVNDSYMSEKVHIF